MTSYECSCVTTIIKKIFHWIIKRNSFIGLIPPYIFCRWHTPVFLNSNHRVIWHIFLNCSEKLYTFCICDFLHMLVPTLIVSWRILTTGPITSFVKISSGKVWPYKNKFRIVIRIQSYVKQLPHLTTLTIFDLNTFCN